MTEGQLKFQQLQETARHNYEMERLGQSELGVKEQQAAAATKQAEASLMQAQTSKKKEGLEERRYIWDELAGGARLFNDSISNAIDFVGLFTRLFK